MAAFTIQLHNLRFFAHHGVYEEEKIIGNEFEVNISLTIEAPKEKAIAIDKTINYADVFRIAKEVFLVPKPLLETVATEIAETIKESFPALKKISVQIIKLHPPIVSFIGSVSVMYQKKYKS